MPIIGSPNPCRAIALFGPPDAGSAGSSPKLPVLRPLPDENTDAGGMARLFIAEVAYPDNGDLREARREMDMMRCVLINRLKYPKDFAADEY